MKMHQSKKAGSTRHYGWVPSKPGFRDLLFCPHPLLTLETTPWLDLSTPTLPPPFVPCLNQGNEGSCGPNTEAECLSLVAERDEKLNLLLPSRQFIYYTTRVVMGVPLNQDTGVDNRSMTQALAKYGWCDDALMPYTDDPSQLATAPSAAAYAQAATRKVSTSLSVPQNETALQGAIASGLPWIFGFTVYESFESDTTSHTGIVTMPTRSEQVLGGHDITVVGFNASGGDLPGVMPGNKWPTGTWKMRNHWYNGSVPWGDGGYCYVPDAYVLSSSLSGDFWVIPHSGLTTSPVPPTPPSPPTPPAPVPSVSYFLNVHANISVNGLVEYHSPEAMPIGRYLVSSDLTVPVSAKEAHCYGEEGDRHEQAAAAITKLGFHGVSFAQILQWIEQYGLPMVLKVLDILGPYLKNDPNLANVQAIIVWVSAALAAMQAGQPIPPLPHVVLASILG